MAMELKIKPVSIPEIVEFNYEELRKWLLEKAEYYGSLVYTEENIADAKRDRAAINKFIKQLNDARIAKKKEFLKPYEDFENKIKELESVMTEPLAAIDTAVKTHEEKFKKERISEIEKIWNSIEEKPTWLTCNQVFDKKWLNKTTSIKAVEDQLRQAVEDVVNKMKWLQEFKWNYEATEIYKKTLDFDKANSEGKEIWEMAQKKNEEFAAKGILRAEVPRVTNENEKTFVVKFETEITMTQAKLLKSFCDQNGITLKKI